MQGGDAEFELINKLIAIHESGKAYDCVVIIRGGGAKSDFWYLINLNYHWQLRNFLFR